MTRDDLLGYLAHDNIQAFLRVIRQGESSQGEDAYTVQFGGSHFQVPPWDHPRQVIKAGGYSSTAAGAYQFLQRTWDSLVLKYGFADFSPINQDCGAVALIAGRGALASVLKGDLDEAIRLCGNEWASLPGSKYGQPTQTLAQAKTVFEAYGGKSNPAPQPVPIPSSAPTEVNPVDPITIISLLRMAGEFVPSLLGIFGGPGSAKEHNVAAAKVAADALVQVAAPGGDLYQAVSNISKNPDIAQAAKVAIADLFPTISEVGGGIVKARESQMSIEQLPFYKQGVFWITMSMLPLVYAIVLAALAKSEYIGDITSETRAQVIGTALGTLLGGIIGYFYGTSAGSQRKTDVLAAK